MGSIKGISRIEQATLVLVASALTALVCLFCMPSTVHAVSSSSQTGDITITFKYDEPASGGTVTLYRFGDIQQTDAGDYVFFPIDELKNSEINLEELDSAEAANALLKELKEAGIQGETIDVPSNGIVVFSDVAMGTYLIEQVDSPKGYQSISPFAINVPNYEDGAYTFQVNAQPKTLSEEEEPDGHEPENNKFRLPQTGQLNWPVPVLVFVGIALICAGVAIRGRRKTSVESSNKGAR